MYRFLLLLTAASAVGLHGWNTLFNNFAVETARLGGQHVGVIQSVREIPGFLALLAVYLMLVVKEHRVSALSILVLGVGIGATGLFPSFCGLALTTLVMSFGFHYYETTNRSLALQYFDARTAPWVMGKQRSVAAMANIAVGLFVYLTAAHLSYRMIYLLLGLLLLGAGLWGLLQNPTRFDLKPQRRRMILRRRYGLYYFLTFMAGARRQIFIAFAVFLMVKRIGYSLQEVTALLVLNNAVNYVAAPWIGRAIIRFGERRVLSLEYASLVLVFVGYAVVETKLAAAVLYVLDHLFFNFAIAIETFFQKIGDPQDIAPTMAVGFTVNHIAAVVLPALGGLLWLVDYRIVFLGGAGMSLVSLLAVQWIRTGPSPHPDA